MEVTISIDDLHPEKGWGCEGDESVEYLQKLNDQFGCKFTLFTPAFYQKKYPLSKSKDWVDFWLDKKWVELASHGYYHMCEDSNRFGECEFFVINSVQQAKNTIELCLEEWDKVGHKPVGWRNPGWLAHPEAVKWLGPLFKYAAVHYEHNHNLQWGCKMIFGADGIHETDIQLHNNNITIPLLKLKFF